MLRLILLWHQHQPDYRAPRADGPRGSFRLPWVRLHALRDYFGMAARLWESPGVRCCVNLTPILLDQLAAYRDGATDRLWELTRRSPAGLVADERLELLRDAFDADWERQIRPHPRYAELLENYQPLSAALDELDLWLERDDPRLTELRARAAGIPPADLVDLAVWFNLAWFPVELRRHGWKPPRGGELSVARLVEKGRGFTAADIAELERVQRRTLAAVIPLHRALLERGQIELTATPYSHPILPLLVDSDRAIIDREGCGHPQRYSYPVDAERQLERGLAVLEREFGRRPRGWWPAEGAVGQNIVAPLARAGARWAATDEGVLALLLGREPTPRELARPHRVGDGDHGWYLFFRDHPLSDAVGFHYSKLSPQRAVDDFLWGLRRRYVGIDNPIAAVILDGENAWGAYPDDGRPFLLRLYAELAAADDLQTVLPSRLLDELESAGYSAPLIYELPHASWIDEFGSEPGNDLGTWIGEPEENRAWDAVRELRERLDELGADPDSHPRVFELLQAAQGSDWFWWFGTDQATAPKAEREFDRLFRAQLRAAYQTAGLEAPEALQRPIASDYFVWTPDRGDVTIPLRTRLFVQTDEQSATLVAPDGAARRLTTRPLGGVMGLPVTRRAEAGYLEQAGDWHLRLSTTTHTLRVVA